MPRSFHRKIAILGALENAMDYAFSLPGDANGTETLMWPLQEPPGYIGNAAVARNDALALGRNILIDGDMEAAGVGDWIVGSLATLTKEAGARTGGSGTKVLRIARNAVNSPFASQANIITIGKHYNVTGWVRSDGNASPRIVGASPWWTGTTSTDWQEVNFEIVANSSGVALQSVTSTGTEYTEWDDVSVKQTDIAAWEAFSTPGDNPLDADITGATVGQPTTLRGIPYGYSFDAINDYINIASAELNSFLNPIAGSLGVFFKSDTWAAGVDYLLILGADANNKIEFYRSGTNLVVVYTAGGVAETFTIASGSPTGWNHLGLTWEVPGNAIAYYNGVAETPQAIAGTWVGNFAATGQVIGASITTPANVWAGDIAAPFLSRFAWTPAQVLKYNQLAGLA